MSETALKSWNPVGIHSAPFTYHQEDFRWRHKVIYQNGFFWLYGGMLGNNTNSNDIWKSSDGTHWTQVTQIVPPPALHDTAFIYFKNKAWIIGGEGDLVDGTGNRNKVWSSPDFKTWTEVVSNAPWKKAHGHSVTICSLYDNQLAKDGLVLVGGSTWGGTSNQVYQSFDGITWTVCTSFPTPITFHNTYYDPLTYKLFILGGSTNSQFAPTNAVYSTVTYSATPFVWTLEGNANWSPRHYHSLVNISDVSNPTFFVIGGMTEGYVLQKDVWKSTDLINWTSIPQTTPITNTLNNSPTQCVDYRNVYILGGQSNFGIVHTSDSKNGEPRHVDTWTNTGAGNSPLNARYHHRIVVLNETHIIACGGFNGSTYLNDVWYSGSSTGSFFFQLTANAGWATRGEHGFICFNNKLWVLGGKGATEYNDIWSSDDSGVTWTSHGNAPWSARHAFSLTIHNNSLYLVGGINGSTQLKDCWVTTNGTTWTQKANVTASATPNLYQHTAISFLGKLWVYSTAGKMYSTTDGTAWTDNGTASFTGRYSAGLIPENNGSKIFLIGGHTTPGYTFPNDVWESSNGTTWTSKPIINAFSDTTHAPIFTMRGSAVIHNGFNGSSPIQQTWHTFQNISSNFSADTTTGAAPLTVNFTDLSAPSEAVFTNYTWNFGDGFSASTEDATHTFSAVGTFTVTHRAYTADDFIDFVKTDYITTTGITLSANFSATPVQGEVPLTVNFTDLSTGNPSQWKWDFGDNTYSTVSNPPAHIYNNPGNYTVSLSAIGTAGLTSVNTKTNYINAERQIIECYGNYSVPAPTISIYSDILLDFIGIPQAGVSPLTVDFEAIVKLNKNTDGRYLVDKYFWFFDVADHPDDYEVSTTPYITHIYTGYIGQQYDVKLEVSLKAERHTPIVITASADFDWDSYAGGYYNANPFDMSHQPIQFTDTSNIAAIWHWDFGDGQISDGYQNPTHTFSADGTYPVTLTINEGESSKTHNITIQSIVICADFGWDSVGHPLAHMDSSPTPFEDMPLQFIDRSTNASAWYWDFGDGYFSATQNPIHDYPVGIYNVTLSANGGVATKTKEIQVSEVVADFGWSAYNPSTGMSADQTPWDNGWGTLVSTDSALQMVNDSVSATNYHWDFGDGSSINNTAAPIHTYSADGIYTITLSADDGASYSQRSKNIEIIHTGLVLWYKGNNTPNEVYGRLNGTWRPNATPRYVDSPFTSAYAPDYRAFDFNPWEPNTGQGAIEMPYYSAVDFSASSQFSIRCRVKKDINNAQIFFFLKGVLYTEVVNSTEDYGVGFDDAKILIWTGDVNQGIRTVNNVVNDLSWHDVLWTYNAGVHTVYIDGTSKALDHNNQDILHGNNPCVIAYGKFKAISYYNGKIDQIQVFNRLITPSTHM